MLENSAPPPPPLPPLLPLAALAPVPVLPVDFSTFPGVTSRPALLSAIGIIGIVVSILGMIINLILLLFAVIFLARSATPVHATRLPTAPAPATLPISQYVSPHGWDAAHRAIILAGLDRVHSLSAQRAEHVEALLADVGKQVMLLSADTMSAEQVAANVTQYTQMPSADGGTPDDVFIMGRGRLQVGDRTAVFYPIDSPSGIRTQGGSIVDAQGTHLGSAQISGVYQRIMALSTNSMPLQQSTALLNQLQMAGQTIITPKESVAQCVAQVQSVQTLSDGTIGISTDSTQISIGPDGTVLSGIVTVASIRPQFKTFRRADSQWFTTDIALALATSIFLLLAALFTLRQSRASRPMLLIYCGAQLLVVGLWIYAATRVGIFALNDTDHISSSPLAPTITGIISAIFPLAVLLVLMSKSIRTYYAAHTVRRVF